jgi:hypothetical protein
MKKKRRNIINSSKSRYSMIFPWPGDGDAFFTWQTTDAEVKPPRNLELL